MEEVTDIITRGDLKSLKRIAKECEKKPSHFIIALKHDRVDMFIWLYENNWPTKGIDLLDIGEETILYYNLEIMRYLHKKEYKFEKKEYSTLAVGRINLKAQLNLEFEPDGLDNPPPEDEQGLEMIQFLRGVSCPISRDAYISAVMSGNIECVKYLHENGYPWHISTCSCAIIGRQIDIFLYVATHNAPLTRYVRRFLRTFNYQSKVLKKKKILNIDPDCESVILSFLSIDTKDFKGSKIKKDKRFIKDIRKGDGYFVVSQPLREEMDMDGDYGISVEY
jgi:hypothetical protein